MSSRNITPEPPDDDLFDEDARAVLQGIAKPERGPSPNVDLAILQMASAKMADIRRRSQIRRAFFGIAAAAACVAISLPFIRQSPPPAAPESAAKAAAPDPDAAAIILHEVRSLFHDQIQSIQRDESGLHLTLTETPISDTSQAVVLEIRRNGDFAEIITFTGQTIEILGQPVTVHADQDGKIQLKKSDGTPIDQSDDALAKLHINARFI